MVQYTKEKGEESNDFDIKGYDDLFWIWMICLPVFIDEGVCVKIYLLWNEWCRGELVGVWLEDKHLKITWTCLPTNRQEFGSD